RSQLVGDVLPSLPSQVCCSSSVPPYAAGSPLSLHDALPISTTACASAARFAVAPSASVAARLAKMPDDPASGIFAKRAATLAEGDRKSTRLNSSHSQISYAVFCLKKKKNHQDQSQTSPCASR